ncbi:MAG: lysoplasmalogenase [Chitinophagales bacterium]
MVAVIHLVAILAGDSLNWLVMSTKPILLFLLLVIFYFQTSASAGVFRKLVLAALFFSWVGDILLLFQQQDANFFLAGLISFLAAHVCYLLAFRKTSLNHQQKLLKEKPWMILLFLAYGIIFFFLIRNGLGDLLIPVMSYMVVILLMGIAALNRFRRVEYQSFLWVFTGALCFMVSDSLLAINKFAHPIPMAGFFIMLTYIAAQYLIVKGSVQQIETEKVKSVTI